MYVKLGGGVKLIKVSRLVCIFSNGINIEKGYVCMYLHIFRGAEGGGYLTPILAAANLLLIT